MKKSIILLLAIFALAICNPALFAATSTATATVSATVPSLATVSLSRDTNSVTRGTATQILFDKLDCTDMAGGDCGFMYAPYRSEQGKNWHIVQIVANGSAMSLGITVTGSIGTTPLSSILKVWTGGFYTTGSSTYIPGTPSTNWEYANGWQRTLNQAFVGTVPFNYQLNIGSAAAGTYSATVTFTLTTT